MTADLTARPLTLTLGTLTLNVSDYTLQMDVPVQKHTLCDGSLRQTLLPESPCTLTVSGALLRGNAAAAVAALESALHLHTAFSFTFAGLSFADMQLTEVRSDVKNTAETAGFLLTLTGVTAS